MNKFKIGDKVVFKKEVLDAISKTNCAKSCGGVDLTKEYYDYLVNETNFEKLGYFEVNEVGSGNLYVGLYIGADLFEHYQEECLYKYKKGDRLTIGYYEGSISHYSYCNYYSLDFLNHFSTCKKIKELFGEDEFIAIACKCNCCIDYSGSFPSFMCIQDLVDFIKELNKKLDSVKESDSITTKNYQNNEIRFQKPKASSKRGVVPAGSTISGRKDKIAISIGHLSYQVCNC